MSNHCWLTEEGDKYCTSRQICHLSELFWFLTPCSFRVFGIVRLCCLCLMCSIILMIRKSTMYCVKNTWEYLYQAAATSAGGECLRHRFQSRYHRARLRGRVLSNYSRKRCARSHGWRERTMGYPKRWRSPSGCQPERRWLVTYGQLTWWETTMPFYAQTNCANKPTTMITYLCNLCRK